MSVTADLIDFARDSGAISSVYNGNGIALTWDAGRSWQHIWDTKNSRRPQAFYGESEYLEPRVPTMISDYGEIMLKWAIMRIGEKARWRRRWPLIDVPADAASVDPQWGFEQLTPITGRLTMDSGCIPQALRPKITPPPQINQLSHVMQMDYDALLAAYMDPSGGSLLRQWLS